MKHTLIKLVDAIIRRMEEHPDSAQSESGIRSWLRGQGYSKRDIDAVMRMVRPHVRSHSGRGTRPAVVARALTAYEDHKLAPESKAALARLDYYGLLEPHERELVLERMDQFDGLVGMDELDYLLSWLVCGNRDYESQHTLYRVFEGDTHRFH